MKKNIFKIIFGILLTLFLIFIIYTVFHSYFVNNLQNSQILTSISDNEQFQINLCKRNDNSIYVIVYKFYDLKNKVGESDQGKKYCMSKKLDINNYKEILSRINNIKGNYYNTDDDSILLIHNVTVSVTNEQLYDLINFIKIL